MIDRKKVIKAFEICLMGGLPGRCRECPYYNGRCSRELMRDALELLKEAEQEGGEVE